MDKTLISARVSMTAIIIVFAVILGYFAWTNYLSFYDSFVWDWSFFDLMVLGIFFAGFFAGLALGIILIVSGLAKSVEREQERNRLKEEIRKELQMEKQQ